MGGIIAPIFSRELYNVRSFGVYIHVYTHKPSLNDNFQTSPISPLRRYDVILGQNDVILGHLRPKKGRTTKGHSFRKNDRIDLKIGQGTCFDALNPKFKQKYRN